MDWPDEYAEALARAAGFDLTLSADETRTILALAREAAHRTERMNAPVAAYLAGRFAAERIRAGLSPAAAVREAFALAEGILPPPTE